MREGNILRTVVSGELGDRLDGFDTAGQERENEDAGERRSQYAFNWFRFIRVLPFQIPVARAVSGPLVGVTVHSRQAKVHKVEK